MGLNVAKSTSENASMSPDPVMVNGRLTDQAKVQMRDLILATLTGYDDVMRVKSGNIQSGNFVTGSQGWQIDSAGNSEFNNGTFRGTLSASVIKNGNGVTIIDATGLVGLNNFPSAEIASSSGGSTASSSFVTVSGSTMNALSLARQTNVFIWYDYYGINTGLADSVANYTEVDFYDNGSTVGLNAFHTGTEALHVITSGENAGKIDVKTLIATSTFRGAIFPFNAGSHTFSLVHRAPTGGNSNWNNFQIGYIVLGN